MLAWTIYLTFAGALWQMLLPKDNARAARAAALITALAGLVVTTIGAAQFNGSFDEISAMPWIRSLGIDFRLGADGISVVLVLLTSVASLAGILFSWNIEHRAKEFFAFYLALIAGAYGVFLSFDLFLIFVFYELAIIPKYFLIAIWGSTRKEYGAMKLALYSFVGSAMVLIGLVAAYVIASENPGNFPFDYPITEGGTFNLVELSKYPFPLEFQ